MYSLWCWVIIFICAFGGKFNYRSAEDGRKRWLHWCNYKSKKNRVMSTHKWKRNVNYAEFVRILKPACFLTWLLEFLEGALTTSRFQRKARRETSFAFSTSFQRKRGENTRKSFSFLLTWNFKAFHTFLCTFKETFFLIQSHCSFHFLNAAISTLLGDGSNCSRWENSYSKAHNHNYYHRKFV